VGLSADPTLPPRIIELGKIIREIKIHNQYLFPTETNFWLQRISVIGLVFEEIQDDLYLELPDFITEEEFCPFDSIYRPPEGIVPAEDYWRNGFLEVFSEAYWKMLRDLGDDTIRIELDELIL
jgi:hypothetical protein